MLEEGVCKLLGNCSITLLESTPSEMVEKVSESEE